MIRIKTYLTVVIVCAFCSMATATTVPFTEDFPTDASGWVDTGASALNWNAAGGPDGSSYVDANHNFVGDTAGQTPVIFRGQDEFGFSGGAFEGDWITDGVGEFSAYVWHDAGMPLTFFARFASPANFPGAVALEFAPVLSNTWTEISFTIEATNPQFVFVSPDFNTVFSNIGHVQLGVEVPAALEGVDQSFTFSLDKPSVLVPEPATLSMLALAACVVIARRRCQ